MIYRSLHDTPSAEPVTLTVSLALALARHPAVGRNRLYEALRTSSLHGVRVGRRTAIHVDELDAWVAAGCPVDAPGA